MSLGVRQWAESRTYSIVLLGFIGSFVLDWFKGAGSWVVIVPAGFALIGGRMMRDSRPDSSIRPTPLGYPTGAHGNQPGEGRGDSIPEDK